ncbi:MAG TPA: hypothetical protein VFG49_06595 [Dyella sp.]|uniref:hypothetical protein n=1 Tax=Dyella sp. TaxID=1869338 RepID=UPI002D77AEEF|nr:hypothetical protein [Dyella sp.]HET6553193.1 hypothetical protein [Dyella sp.]
MAYKHSRRVDLGAVLGSLFAALQWRLLLLWVLLLLLPVAVASLPLLAALSALLDRSVHASAWAHHFDVMMFGDVMQALGPQHAMVHGALLASVICAVLLLPWLNGMVVASGRSGRSLGFGALLQGGLSEYGRMFRLLLWSLLPYAGAVFLVQFGLDHTDDRVDAATLESQADTAQHIAWWLSGLVLVIAQSWVESARAAFIADGGLRSAMVAMIRGLLQLLRRPFSTLFAYLLVTVIGFAIALGLGLLRAHTLAADMHGLLLGFLLSLLVVVALGWMRTARLYALSEVARSVGGRRLS